MPPSDLSGRVALITGAGSGLGAAMARRLAADGAVIVVNDLDPDAAKRVAAEVDGTVAVFDVTDSAAVDAGIDDAVNEHGRLDIVVNNAGIAPNRPEVRERSLAHAQARAAGRPPEAIRATSTLSDAAWDRMIRTHLYGTFYGTRAALRHMEPVASGAIVNVASIYGYLPQPSGAEYAAAKGAIVQFTRSVGHEVAHLGIRVNAVAPGFIETPLLQFMDDERRQMTTARIGAGRLGRAEEVAEAVRFLAGDEASYCFGDVLMLSGAFT